MAAVNNEESSSSMCEFPYHVFLSFRGEDTRKNFTDHLYTALKGAGIHVFRDDDAIERGADIECEVEKAIRHSKMSLIVFSSDFASSSWCLDEVAMIMEHKKHHSGHNVLPVFYDVDPSEVQKQTGDLAEAFSGDGKRFKDEKIEGWRSALCKVTNLAGMVLHKRPEAGFIQDIVKKVREMLKRTILHVPSYLVGVDAQVKDINNWIQDRPEDVNIAVIHGIAGVGKTTIAKNVCNLNFEQFDCWSFLKDVRKTSKQYNGLVQLQMQLLSDLSKGGFQKINNVDEGIIQIRYATRFKKVLIVLDDVDDVDQLKSILEVGKWLYKGSKIIITTRHGRLQSFHDQPCKEFRIMPLDDSESLQLFSWHAFRQSQPSEDYLQDSKNIVRYCGGLPLALEVIGVSLSGRSGDSWKRAIKEPEALDGGKIHEILRVSYHSLQDDRDKNLFLDIACFFIGEDITFVERIVESCDFYRNVGIQELIDKNLISIDKDNKLAMHQLLREMGCEIVRQESPENHGERSRIWRHGDSFKILRKKTGSRSVKSFILDWEQVNIASKCLDLNTDAFASMSNLKLIHLNNLRLKGGYENFPKGLVWLCWHHAPWDHIPVDFYLEDLIVLDLCNSSLRHVWHGIRCFPGLKILNLSRCHGLGRTPDFSGLLCLEILILEECTNLAEVHKSIGNLQNLSFSSFKDCINLKRLPDEMCQLTSLRTLILSGCSKLDSEIPNQLEKMKFLRVIRADGPLMSQLQKCAPRMWSWLMRNSTLSTKRSIDCLPSSLVNLSLANCNIRDDMMPNILSSLPCLEHLDLGGNPFQHLPERSNFGPLMGPLDNYMFGRLDLDKPQGLFKLEQLLNFDMEMIYNFGLQKSESTRITQDNTNFVAMTTQGKTTIQVFQDGGISNIYLRVHEIPDWLCHATGARHACYCVPSSSSFDICGFNICVVYTCSDPRGNFESSSSAKIRIEAKGQILEYTPEIFGVPEANEDMLWLSHWKLSCKLEADDSVACSVILPSCFQVKKFGIHLVSPHQNSSDKEGQTFFV
ncbi:disease resistance protein RUN1-like [Populus alba x Populus x berolinensis]|uniref:Disease resistance protein RUN1-like n=1 Tax=Populus alba x Populus x berolinensis TaxID=444605 RepID=A0AAD6PNK3_9ROSI|nr:disease resistance protein RUN1-like [Populus alba x Populus x berolinensis]